MHSEAPLSHGEQRPRFNFFRFSVDSNLWQSVTSTNVRPAFIRVKTNSRLFISPGRRSPTVRRCRRLRCHKIARNAVYSYTEHASGCDAGINRPAGNKLSRFHPPRSPFPEISPLFKPGELTSPRFIRFYSLSRNTRRNETGERGNTFGGIRKQRNPCLRERIMAWAMALVTIFRNSVRKRGTLLDHYRLLPIMS